VAVIVPFAEQVDVARQVLAGLARLRTAPADELLLVDNSREQVMAGSAPPDSRTQVVAAPRVRSSYHARNVGAARTHAEWLLFIDADCRPRPDLIDAYFSADLPPSCGAVAGAIEPATEREGLVARHARARAFLNQAAFLARERPFAATANLLVRRSAWATLGGFCEVRSGGDVDFCWRLQRAGFSLERRPAAIVDHRHRDDLRSMLGQRMRYGAGAAWLRRRYPGARARPRLARAFLLNLGRALGASARGRTEDAAFFVLDALEYAAHGLGSLLPNEPRPHRYHPGNGLAGPRR
jgi:glycosyltransferase involved in cell wall biosynthesis